MGENSINFVKICVGGDIKLVKEMYYKNDIDINIMKDAFIQALVGGKLPIVKWIYSLGVIDIHEDDDLYFSVATECDRFKTAQWIYSLGGVNIYNRDELSIYDACYNGNIEMAQWLYSIYKSDGKEPNFFDDLIHAGLFGKQFKIIDWLFTLNCFPGIEAIISLYDSSEKYKMPREWFKEYLMSREN